MSDTARTGSRNPFASPGFTRWWLASMVAGTGIGIQAVTVPLFVRDRVELDLRAVAIAGALIAPAVAWDLGDIFLGIVILPNLLALILLSGKVREMMDGYFERKPWEEIAARKEK